ncbi:hypothetical protein [Nocardia sp. bgisy134]|uniref:hypothetical protein n=1 Tax=Nocardia sp. bgisy134 TaxID=3413789 RepID=UPI003D71ABA0
MWIGKGKRHAMGVVPMAAAVALAVGLVAGCGHSDKAPGTTQADKPASATTAASAPGQSSTQSTSVPSTPVMPAGTPTAEITTPHDGGNSSQPAPPPANPPQGTGTVVIRTHTLNGAPVPNVPVELSLRQPCDPAIKDIPTPSTEALRRDAVTDANGTATFTVPAGCYRFGMGTPPPGATPVPEGLHTLFLVHAGQTVTGKLRFQDSEPSEPCAVQTVLRELDIRFDHLRSAKATVSQCDGKWAHIVWDSPGDSARIIRRTAGGWTNYVFFPHDICWGPASADGVPVRFKEYFTC